MVPQQCYLSHTLIQPKTTLFQTLLLSRDFSKIWFWLNECVEPELRTASHQGRSIGWVDVAGIEGKWALHKSMPKGSCQVNQKLQVKVCSGLLPQQECIMCQPGACYTHSACASAHGSPGHELGTHDKGCKHTQQATASLSRTSSGAPSSSEAKACTNSLLPALRAACSCRRLSFLP